ncbi:Mut7-C ubiquitin/RNAse domain-containing protein [bacterium]|nr:Mut7-C ubiquitin/RNAse domain-containing protein [bacterium]MBU1064892.1 Mut7-C ubiquitin/RNAse domain-containing protein [bacterium]MBU1633300.1 Mut7-C ubiquitin/RNAse domain-containing protein [bacterium]MBU1874732.1 Mut7-C ubiquitin/RNAse domain-containing protein [bacterium]
MNTRQHAPVKHTAFFRFYEELNDFLPEELHKKPFPIKFIGKPSIKDAIESIGVPHTEIDLIIVNTESVGFDYRLHGNEYVSVYPVFESLDITSLVHLRPKPIRVTKFVVDVNLGKLARKLRLLGFDSLFKNNFTDDEIIKLSLQEKRVILTRDKGILKHNVVTHGYWIRNDDPKLQLSEVVSRFQLQNSLAPFTRCSTCNELLHQVDKAQIQDRLPLKTRLFCKSFMECGGCGKIYWRGSHYKQICKMIEILKRI